MARTPERIGEYQIERQLARAGACLEYEGTHLVLPRRAVIKLMAPTQHAIAVSVLREACLLEALQHPGDRAGVRVRAARRSPAVVRARARRGGDDRQRAHRRERSIGST